MLFVNNIDKLRKLGDMIAMIIFLVLAIYFYNKKDYILTILMIIFFICDLIFTIDAINLHGFNMFFN